MLITFLVILFSDLTFADVSVQALMQWYSHHPFAFILAIQDIILGALILFRIFNQFVDAEDEDDFDATAFDDCCDITRIAYSDNEKDKIS